MYVPEALRCMAAVSLRSQRLKNEGDIDPDDEEKGCKHCCKRLEEELLHSGHQGYQATRPAELPPQGRWKRYPYAYG